MKALTLSTNSYAARLTFSDTENYSFTSTSSTLQSSNGITLNGSGNVSFDTLVSFGNSASRDINGTGTGTISFNRNITGNSGLRISGSGAFRVLFNANQESTANGNSITNGNATLGGVGTLSRLLTVGTAGATIAPGIDGVTGNLTLAGGLSTQLETHFDFDLGGISGSNDQLRITEGTFLLRSSAPGSLVLNLNDLGTGAVSLNTPITLIDVAPTGVTLDFGAVTSSAFAIGALPTGWVLDSGYGVNGILFNTSTGDLSVQLSAIPEPAAVVFFGVGAALLLARRKRH